jgi:hypothetical protein
MGKKKEKVGKYSLPHHVLCTSVANRVQSRNFTLATPTVGE